MNCHSQSEFVEDASAALSDGGVPAGGGHSAPLPPPSARASSGWAAVSAVGLIVLATAAVYHNSLTGPFILDDLLSITENSTIRQLWPIWKPLCPPYKATETVGGRPLLNLTLALNYAMSGYDVRSYHATNLAIHILAALLLFGILRRTFLLPTMHIRCGRNSRPTGSCHSPALGDPSASNRVGNIYLSSGPSHLWGCSIS